MLQQPRQNNTIIYVCFCKTRHRLQICASGDVVRTEADVTDLVENLGYKPDTPIQKGIDEFVEWYLSTNYMKRMIH
ncbi:MAG: hypothetical protein ACTSYY_11785 [Promethearchaeota archaeon]